MSFDNDDNIPLQNPYLWDKHHGSGPSLDDFLKKYKPSMVQNDGTKHWIWVTRERPENLAHEGTRIAAIMEAHKLLTATTLKVESIQGDASIPTRGNKKNGTKSKKEVREEVQAETAAQLKEISVKHKYCTGKWLMFAGHEKVDIIWSSLAKSLITGPLSETDAFTIKVSTSPMEDTPNYQHVICLYMPNVYDRDSVTKVMRVLLRNHGMNLSGVKSDLYTLIGIKSKHPSGMPSTVFKTTDLMKDTEMKELKDTFYKELKKTPATKVSAKAGPGGATDTDAVPKSAGQSKPKRQLKKAVKAKLDDPFGSDSDGGNGSDGDGEADAKKGGASTRKRTRGNSDSEDEVKPKKKMPARK